MSSLPQWGGRAEVPRSVESVGTPTCCPKVSSEQSDGASAAEPIKVDIWSDVQCPWCYIGKRRFEQALAGYDGPVEVEFHSFELSPDSPFDFDGDARTYLRRKGMDDHSIDAVWERLESMGADVGLELDPASMVPTNTSRAHQLLHLAKEFGLQSEMNDRLLHANFVEGRHVGHLDDLIALATEVGLDAETVRVSLVSDEFIGAVRSDEERARDLDIHGVPFFVFDGRYGISGAQETDAFRRVLERVASDRSAASEPRP